MDTFKQRYLTAHQQTENNAEERTALKNELPEEVPVAWYLPYFSREKLEFATYFSIISGAAGSLLEADVRDSDEYADLFQRIHKTLLVSTRYVDLRLFSYEVTQVFLGLEAKWDYTRDRMLEFSRLTLNSFFVLINNFVYMKDSPEQFLSFMIEIESLFISASKKTTRRLRELELREQTMDFITEELEQYLAERAGPSVKDYNFKEVEQKRTLVSQMYIFSLELFGKVVGPLDIMSVFDLINCNERVPYVVCTDEKHKKFIKVYTGKSIDQPIPYSRLVLEKKRGYRVNTIELTFWLGEGSLQISRKGSFFRIVIDFNTGKLTLKLPSNVSLNYDKRMRNILQDLGTHLSVVEDLSSGIFSTETQIAAPSSFVFHEFLFYDLIGSHPFFRECFYSEERVMPASRRKQIKLRYVPYLSKDFRTSDNESIVMPVSWSLSIKGTADLSSTSAPRIRVLISNTNEEMVQSLIQDLLTCLQFYYVGLSWGDIGAMPESLKVIKRIYKTYSQGIPELARAEPTWRTDQPNKRGVPIITTTRIQKTKHSQYRKLTQEFSDIFGSGYHKLCRGKAAPQVFRTLEAAKQAASAFTVDGNPVEPMRFPYSTREDEPGVWAVPSDSEFPYANIILNTDPETSATYSYLPCFTSTKPERTSYYNLIYHPEEEAKGTKTDRHIFRTDKFLPPGSEGELETSFLQILQLPSAYSYGVVYHPSKASLIHCVILANRDETYKKNFLTSGFKTDIQAANDRREQFVKRIRAYFMDGIEPALLKQELYDYTDEEIANAIKDENRFFDSKLFYRIIEERYNINVFVFSNAPKENKDRFPVLEIPRCTVYHTREVRLDRKSLLLLKNYGPTLLLSLNREPQYEIIRSEGGRMLYGREVTKICYKLLQQTQTVLTWTREGTQLKLYKGISFMHRFSTQLNGAVLSQFIDAAGYTRIINFQHEKGKVSMFVPPSQPLNVPVIKRIDREYARISSRDIQEIFSDLGPPSGCAKRGDVVVGLWFPYLGMEMGIYVPIKPIKSKKYAVLSADPYEELILGESLTEKIIKVKETANFIKQLVIWLFSVYRQQDKDAPLELFIANYVSYSELEEPQYDFEQLPEKLPTVTFLEEAILYLASVTKDFIRGRKIHCYNRSLLTRIIYFLNAHAKKTEGLSVPPEQKIKDYFLFRKFYNSNKNVRIFLNHENFTEWMRETMESQDKFSIVQTKIDSSLAIRQLPFVIHTEEGYFLVENLQHGKSRQMLQKIGADWINSSKTLPFLIYLIVRSGTVIPGNIPGNIAGVTEGEPYIRVLRYGNASELSLGRYKEAAMLPL